VTVTGHARDRIVEIRGDARRHWTEGDIDKALDAYEALLEAATEDYGVFHDALFPDADRALAEALTLALLPGTGETRPDRARRYALLAAAHHAGTDLERIGWAGDFARIGDRESALRIVRYLRRSQGPHAVQVMRHPRLSPLVKDPEFEHIFAGIDPGAVAARNTAHVERTLRGRPLPADLRTLLTQYWTGRWPASGLLRDVRFFDEREDPFAACRASASPADVAHLAVLHFVVPVLCPNNQYLRGRVVGYWVHPEEQSQPWPIIALGPRPGEYELLGTTCTLAEALVAALHRMELGWRDYMRTNEGSTYDDDATILDEAVTWLAARGVAVSDRPVTSDGITVHPKVLFDAAHCAELARSGSQTRLWDWFERSRRKPEPS
jgi:hypothetical protein